MKQEEVNLELIDFKLDSLSREVEDLKHTIENQMVTRTEFELRVGRIEKLVFGMVGLILTGVLGAVLTLIL